MILGELIHSRSSRDHINRRGIIELTEIRIRLQIWKKFWKFHRIVMDNLIQVNILQNYSID